MSSKPVSILISIGALAVALAACAGSARANSPSAPPATADLAKQIVETPIADAPTYAKRALVIGIDGYVNVPQLTDCDNDAAAFANFLKAHLGFTDVTVMTDDSTTPANLQPTFTNLTHQLNLLLSGIVPGQTQFVLFYSGHGVRTQNSDEGDADWLVPIDADPTSFQHTCINYTAFKNELDTRQPARAILVMDACRNILQGKTAVGDSGFGGAPPDIGPQIAEFLSCQPTQTSLEGLPSDFHQSVFTHFLLQGWSGDPDALESGTDKVTFDSLKTYVQGKVSNYARTVLNSAQLPDGRATLGGMVLAKFEPSATGTRSLPPAGTPQADTRAHLQLTGVPDGAKITLDGAAEAGPSIDLDMGDQVSKSVQVSVTRDGFSPFTWTVKLTVGLKTLVTYDGAPLASQTGDHIGSIQVNPKDGAEMVYVPAGDFTMGTDLSTLPDYVQKWFKDAPKHTVTLDAYWIYKNDVTVAQYEKFCDETGRAMPADPPAWGWVDNDPMVNVTWDDANAYAKWAGASLPTEAQWEKAARGTDGRKYPWGNDWDPDLCVHSAVAQGDSMSTQPVGSIPAGASPYGALDMAGNVYNWCTDWYDSNYYNTGSKTNPTGLGSGVFRVMRGGSYYNFVPLIFSTFARVHFPPSTALAGIGFRCVKRAYSD